MVPRQILSGIREYLEDPQWLVGKKFPYIVNLEPRTIRGFESQGMILAASHEGILALLAPTNDIPPGTRIK
jgi:methionyl-tRNA synthetase